VFFSTVTKEPVDVVSADVLAFIKEQRRPRHGAARADTDALARLVTELLARTGIRRGELLELTVDAVV